MPIMQVSTGAVTCQRSALSTLTASIPHSRKAVWLAGISSNRTESLNVHESLSSVIEEGQPSSSSGHWSAGAGPAGGFVSPPGHSL